MVSGSISTFSSKCFSPFPHGTGSLSVSFEYLALPDGPGGFTQDYSCPALLRIPLCRIKLRVRGYHPLWPLFPKCSAHSHRATSRSYNPGGALPRSRFGLFPVRSPLLGESLNYFLFLRVLRCFSSPRWRHAIARQVRRLGLSHSEIHGSKVICTSPWLVAAYHVLHRLNEPRHPPFALIYFLSSSLNTIAGIGNSAHTFSCIVYRLSLCETCLIGFRSTMNGNLSYSFACVNMSKILCQWIMYNV